MSFILKICQNCYWPKYGPSISRIFQSNFWRVFDVWPNCAAEGKIFLVFGQQKNVNYHLHLAFVTNY